jgi:hypothetical protein
VVYDNHPVDQPKSPAEGYHLTEDPTGKALELIKDAKTVAPDKAVLPVLRARRGPCAAPRPEAAGRR